VVYSIDTIFLGFIFYNIITMFIYKSNQLKFSGAKSFGILMKTTVIQWLKSQKKKFFT